MSFWKKLFSSGSASEAPAVAATAEHKGFTIEAQPYKEQGQWQLAGVISREVDGQRREHRFVRADRFSSRDEAAELALSKARQIIDEQGANLFR
jgi:hypothetical protein